MLGFLPGFPYLGGLDERIHTPRLGTPRKRIPAGSVGMTPVRTYDPERQNPILVEAGDYIRFVPVCEREFQEIRAAVEAGTYRVTTRKGDT